MSAVMYKGDTGTRITLDCGVTVSAATVMKVRARKPSGGIKEWDASLNNSTSIRYDVLTGDIDVAGKWQLQAYIEMPGWKGRGEWATVEVKD